MVNKPMIKLKPHKSIEDIDPAKIEAFVNGAKDVAAGIDKGIINTNVNVNVNVDNDAKKLSFDEQYSRQTIYVRNDLIKAIDKKIKRMGKGAKTKLYNDALAQYLANK